MVQSATAVSPAPIAPYAPPRLTVFDTGSEQCPQGQLPGKLDCTPEEARNAANPLQYVPIVGMVYRQATGETVPPPFLIAGSAISGAIFGGPLGVLGSIVLNLAQELARLGPDTSRPPVPEGMQVTGSEAGVTSVSPGDPTPPGGYTTLATILPDFLGGGANGGDGPALAGDGPPVRQAIAAYEAGSMFGHG